MARVAPLRVPFAAHRDDTTTPTTVLSALAAAHAEGRGVLAFFDTRQARALREVCTGMRAAVAAFPWADAETRIARRLDRHVAAVEIGGQRARGDQGI